MCIWLSLLRMLPQKYLHLLTMVIDFNMSTWWNHMVPESLNHLT